MDLFETDEHSHHNKERGGVEIGKAINKIVILAIVKKRERTEHIL